jgi:hypothetical protein
VPVSPMTPVNAGLAAVVLGGLLLLSVAVWWSWTGDGLAIPRDRWPGAVRGIALAGWGLFLAGVALQVVGYFTQVGVAHFPPMMGPGH